MRPWGGTEMKYRGWFLGALGVATSVIVVVLVVVPSALSVGGPNEYTVSSFAPTSVVAGTAHTYAVTMTDSGSSGKIGAANVTIPVGYTSSTVGTPTTSSGKSWTASIVSGVVQL